MLSFLKCHVFLLLVKSRTNTHMDLPKTASSGNNELDGTWLPCVWRPKGWVKQNSEVSRAFFDPNSLRNRRTQQEILSNTALYILWLSLLNPSRLWFFWSWKLGSSFNFPSSHHRKIRHLTVTKDFYTCYSTPPHLQPPEHPTSGTSLVISQFLYKPKR